MSLSKLLTMSVICMLIVSGCSMTNKMSPCNADQTILNLREKISYDESVILYNTIQGESFLVVWFVDPNINPMPKESEISQNATLAFADALILSQQVNADNECVGKLFDKVSTIVVDTNYNGWLSGQISVKNLPSSVQTDENQLYEIAKSYEVGYYRDRVTTPSIATCSWKDAKQKIQNHFSTERTNIGFYFVLDNEGVNVWAQWDSDPASLQVNIPPSLLNIAMEIDCLSPDRIVFDVVDNTGEMQVIGMWNWSDAKNQDIGKVQILYQK